MTTNQTNIPEPTSPAKVAGCARCDRIEAHALGIEGLLGRRRDQLAKAREEIDQLKARIADLEDDKPEPGPWLRGDELKAVMPTLKAGDVVEVDDRGHATTGKLWAHSPSGLSLWFSIVRTSNGEPGPYVDALRVIERAPEPEPEWPDDQVVMVRFRRFGNGWKVARRDEGGEWITRDDVNGLPADLLAERFEVRRLSPEAHAELLAIVRGEQA